MEAARGDPEAIARFLTAARPLILRYCRARIGRKAGGFAQADEVAQEVCLALLTALPGHGPGDRSFLPGVYRLAQQKIRAAGPPGEPPDARLGALLRVLPERQREILTLRMIVGLSAEQSALVLGLTPSAVRVQQHRALARLRGGLGSGSTAP
ncbi:sigma factor-like helix-turn-helix DNA-binding protein [Amycolatopsis rhabdoformis]|uniref:Sigma factor-like helix-turn-helix DNA-binding protein n=1 Tax=Amycolatopsis rhabdoformis TaxID=1448059 RepID=A0ABZ1IBT2_9PSEU|nr:sigma factor-like helix-turn-helix DNA-binding protein [Amycolatopsis rhabdoformis]WSE31382.1 sigma factor-like helix-turn-helix DNA-binding protein [Amycolatopsis rhabdoformis]